MAVKIVNGDVFLIPVSDSIVGIGQVADMLPEELYLVVYEETWRVQDTPNAPTVVDCTPLFSALSLDAKLWNGDWRIIGNQGAASELRFAGLGFDLRRTAV